jgi:putative ABC transport system permease protein
MRLVPLHERFVGYLRAAMWILMGAVTLLLLTACANLSSLFLAKAAARTTEIAMRFSLGASRWAIARQFLTESLLITLLGAASGISLAYLCTHLVKTLGPGNIQRLDTVSIDTVVLTFSTAVSVLTGILFGVMPALRSTRIDLVQSLKEGAQSTETRRSLRTRTVLVVAQVALSLLLLIGSGLLIKSLYRLQQVNPGFNPQGVLTMELQLPTVRYDEPSKQERFFSEALERIRALPGVVDASAVSGFPLRGGPWNYIHRVDRPPRDPSERLAAVRRQAMEGYFRTLQIPLLAGRTFEPTDRLASRLVVVVSETLAERLFPGGNPIGKLLVHPWHDDLYLEIIGVVGDLKDYGLDADYRPVFYLAFRQATSQALNLAIRVDGETTALTLAIRDLIRDLDKDVPISNISTLEARVSESTSAQKFQTLLLGTFAAIALILTAIGLYGVLTYFVSQRTRELGIRIALGAGGAAVMYEVVRKGIVMAGLGIAGGLLGGLATGRLIQSLLFETSTTDPATYVLVSLFLVLVATAACVLPAIRAVRIDPVRALKTE